MVLVWKEFSLNEYSVSSIPEKASKGALSINRHRTDSKRGRSTTKWPHWECFGNSNESRLHPAPTTVCDAIGALEQFCHTTTKSSPCPVLGCLWRLFPKINFKLYSDYCFGLCMSTKLRGRYSAVIWMQLFTYVFQRSDLSPSASLSSKLPPPKKKIWRKDIFHYARDSIKIRTVLQKRLAKSSGSKRSTLCSWNPKLMSEALCYALNRWKTDGALQPICFPESDSQASKWFHNRSRCCRNPRTEKCNFYNSL